MRSRCAVYVDAGYLLAASATRITSTPVRANIEADHERLIEALVAHAEKKSGLPLLRVHWYDAARDGVPDETQQKIGLLPRVKLRLGRVGFDGVQKGVDLRIGLDLVAHARNAAVEAVYLVSGDDDLAEAVEEAQAHGVQVTILAVPTKTGDLHGVSRHLQGTADGLDLLAPHELDSTIKPRAVLATDPVPAAPQRPEPSPVLLANRESPARPSSVPEASPAGLVYAGSTGADSVTIPGYVDAEVMDRVVSRILRSWLEGHTTEQRTELLAGRPVIPQDVDGALLHDLSEAVDDYHLSETIRHQLRSRFWAAFDQSQVI